MINIKNVKCLQITLTFCQMEMQRRFMTAFTFLSALCIILYETYIYIHRYNLPNRGCDSNDSNFQ